MIKKLSLLLIVLIISKNSWAAEQEILIKTSQDWSGQELTYPKRQTELTTLRITIAPQEIIPFHCHQVALFGYVLSGSVQVETMSGKKETLKKGETLVEVQNTWHRGFNPSKSKNTEIVLFYVGSKGVDNAIIYNEVNKGKCHE
ncbi:MAG: cupin domain-containing protein [Pseudomonadota bacterium]